MNVSAIIMAAGLSKRMNQNKLMMKINEKYIYEFIFETINMCSDSFSEIIVVAKETEILEKACEFGFFAVKNEISHLGQSASVRLGVENSNKPDGYMFFVADQPFIKDDTIRMLLSVFEKSPNSIIIASYNGKNGNPVIFPKLFKTQLLNLEGDIGGKIIIKNNPDKLIRVHIDTEDEFIDIDTLKDYERILKKVID